jgi:DNA-directed RNA polymerase subunit N (RpoN/RPB10)
MPLEGYIKCPSCGRLLADKSIEYEDKLENIYNDNNLTDNQKMEKKAKLLDDLGITKICCRSKFMSSIPFHQYIH